ncbi:MAG: M23 family metallopeptidase [Treponema sp.]|nr:M23 family metallopeptidase [Treponema sp.]
MGKTGKGAPLAFFLLFLCSSLCASEDLDTGFPEIARLDGRDTGFRQFIADVEGNRRRLVSNERNPAAAAESLTIYQYSPGQGEDIFFLAARCNIPYSALASLNRLDNPMMLETGRPLLLPSCPGIFIPANISTDLEKLLFSARAIDRSPMEITISSVGSGSRPFYFYPGDDFTPTERVFFLNSGFRFPLQFFSMTSTFGPRQNPFTGNVVQHTGLDLAAPEGTAVYTTADGIVAEIGEDPVYGIYIIIKHSDTWTSLYGHLQKVETTLRTAVKSGNLIGRVGSTGQSTGPHLHFELRQNGRPIDPGGRLRS